MWELLQGQNIKRGWFLLQTGVCSRGFSPKGDSRGLTWSDADIQNLPDQELEKDGTF